MKVAQANQDEVQALTLNLTLVFAASFCGQCPFL